MKITAKKKKIDLRKYTDKQLEELRDELIGKLLIEYNRVDNIQGMLNYVIREIKRRKLFKDFYDKAK